MIAKGLAWVPNVTFVSVQGSVRHWLSLCNVPCDVSNAEVLGTHHLIPAQRLELDHVAM